MNLFSKFLSGGKELQKLGNAVAYIKNILDAYETDLDESLLYCATWICKVGILDRIEKNHWSPNYIVFVDIKGHLTKMTMMEVQMHTTFRLIKKFENLYDSKLKENLKDALNGGEKFKELNEIIPFEMKSIIE